MTLAMAIVIAGQGVIWGSVAKGAGRHLGDIPIEDLPDGLKLNFISQPIFLIAICVVKLAVGATLLRIASTKFYRHLILSIMGFMSFYTIGCFFTIIFQCSDIRALWDFSVQPNCWPQSTLQGLSYTNVALNIITDLLFAVFIPAPMLWNLNVNMRTKLSLMFALGLGCFACCAAFIKIGSLVNYGKEGDWLWDSRDISIWTVVECNLGIMAGSIPTLRPMFKRVLGTTLGYGARSDKITGGGYQRHEDTLHSTGVRKTGSKHMSRNMGTVTDESSSERAFNAAHHYEMGGLEHGKAREAGLGMGGGGAVPLDGKDPNSVSIFVEADARSSDESVNQQIGRPTGGHLAPGRDRSFNRGITKTTTTTVNFAGVR